MRARVLLPLLLGTALVGAFVFARSGAFNPAADEPHWPITHGVLDYVRERGIATRTGDIVVPDLDDPELIRAGAGNYAAMCVDCHLAPGMEEGEIQRGMYPTPPDLSAVDGLDPADTFWVIKHGVKMSGMPAWGKSMDNSVIWGMTAFVRRLPAMTAEEYAALVASSGGHDHGGGAAPGGDMPGMDHGAKPETRSGDMAGMDHGARPETKAGDMEEMDHGARPETKSGAMAGMDHSSMKGMKPGEMTGMDHSSMKGMKPAPARTISGPAEASLQAFQDALQVGNVGLALERLDPDLVVVEGGQSQSSREAYAAGQLRADMAFLKNAKVRILNRRVESGEQETVIVTESRMTTSGAGKPIDVIRTERATLRATPEGWKILRLEWQSRPAEDGVAE